MIRPATIEDAPAIAAIHVRAWQAAYAGVVPAGFLAGLSLPKRIEFWQRELTAPSATVLVAVEAGAVVGWLSGGDSRDADARGESEVFALYVAPEWWRRGIGRRLMSGFEAGRSPDRAITLWVLAQNQRAIDFYGRWGCTFDGATKSVQIGGVMLDEMRLRKAGRSGANGPDTRT